MHSKYLSLFTFILITLAISGLGGLVTAPAVEGWYKTINKPSFNPPNWVFAPVWTALYVMIAVSGWLVWGKLKGIFTAKIKHRAMLFYWQQLFFNLTWSYVFFYFHEIEAALVNIIILLIYIELNIKSFFKISKPAAYLLVPYFLWVLFASTLNAAIVILN